MTSGPLSLLSLSRGKDGTMSRRPPEHRAGNETLLLKTFALNLRAARKSKRMTQAEAAKAIGISTNIYWRYETARRSIVACERLRPRSRCYRRQGA
jgi:DNA-binding XRE family transcriptional regulator